jgi:hypothetical protein
MPGKRHGFTIGIERTDDQFYLSMKAVGKLTHADYEVISPLIDKALGTFTHPHVRAFIDVTELDGWDARAAWDDLKLGLKHGNEFVKIALVGNQHWQETAARIGSWFVSGEMKSFEEANVALEWLNS